MKKEINAELLINDMLHANGEASLILKPYNEDTWEEYEKCTFAFFPGCRLGAIEPEFVLRTYDTILSMQPDTAVFLHCCGFPAELADENKLHDEVLDKIISEWNSLGRPKLITACDTCAKIFSEYLPEIPTITLETLLDDPVAGQIAKYILDENDLTDDEKQFNRMELKEILSDLF